MLFNINKNVKVKLTDYGRKILEEQHNEMRELLPSLREFKPRGVDEDGYSVFRLWVLMDIFGYVLGARKELPFEPEILIEE